jgi:hypothetical protein
MQCKYTIIYKLILSKIGKEMDVKNYLEKAEMIRKNELMSIIDLANELNIAFTTWKRVNANPEICSLKTMRKLKMFVDKRNQYEPTAND